MNTDFKATNDSFDVKEPPTFWSKFYVNTILSMFFITTNNFVINGKRLLFDLNVHLVFFKFNSIVKK